MKTIQSLIFPALILFIISIFFSPFFLQGKIPIPSDALVGLYHPWRDSLVKEYPNGYPYKNPLITDPVRQQYVYRKLAIDELKQGRLPTWNPYSFSGTPQVANIQTAAYYPLNIIFWIFSFETSWSILVFLQPLLAGFSMYAYLRNLKLTESSSFLGSISFAFCGFMIAWMEWNTIGHVALWLPLVLLCKDKLLERFNIKWVLILIFAETSSFLAGHLQTWLYIIVFSTVYLVFRLWQKNKLTKSVSKNLLLFIFAGFIVFLLILPQLIPTYNFITQSARNFDLPDSQRDDWFIPVQHLIQFVVPDFFGNPATGNYWGVWNYGEFVGYTGLLTFIMAIFALIFLRKKEVTFYAIMLLISLILAISNPLSQLPYILQIPFLSTLQPSRIIFLIDFCLIVLGAMGIDYLIKNADSGRARMTLLISTIFVLIFLGLWTLVLFGKSIIGINEANIAIRNLTLPTILLINFLSLIFGYIKGLGFLSFWQVRQLTDASRIRKKIDSGQARVTGFIIFILITLAIFDLLRFGMKFTPLTDKQLLFPQTKAIDFLQQNLGNYRLMTTDRRILPPNTSTYYKLQSVDGYDPLYLKSYGESVASWTRNAPDISPASFNRILTPEKIDSFFTDLLGVKYVLSLKEETDPKLNFVFQEDETRIYENLNVAPRVFLAEEVVSYLENKQLVFDYMFRDYLSKNGNQLTQRVFTTAQIYVNPQKLESTEFAKIIEYLPNKVTIETNTVQERLLVLTDLYFSDWKVYINGKESSIFPVNYLFRGVIVPKGEAKIVFEYK